jgi:pimeloyl-ACP methyl ester carboxylesterase
MTDSLSSVATFPISRFVTAPDGLKLHALEFGSRLSDRLPVVCLAGLTRNARDFLPLARRLAQDGRRVLALDYRGRGLSARDRRWQHYDLRIEGEDIVAVLTALGVGPAIVIGTSRGGIHAMLLAALRPTLIAGAVLNDIGPIIEPQGLIRIKTRVGLLPEPTNWAQAADMLRLTYGPQFPALEARDWDFFAHATVRETNDRLAWDYDPALSRTLGSISPEMAPLDLWPQFRALARVPILAIRGANSDILSDATFKAMQATTPRCEGLVVAGQGHAPLLADTPTMETIAAFVDGVG